MRTLVLGATPRADKYAYKAVERLKANHFEAIPVGIRTGEIAGIPIQQGQPSLQDIHTVTLYLGPDNQKDYYHYILGLKPKRIIFNPGTENPEFYTLIRQSGQDIQIEIACTLVLLSRGVYA